jgi:folate-dependent phosphoribosylglycinamide formyltransferase PurN
VTSEASIRVVVVTSGPALEEGLRDLIERLEQHPDIARTALLWETRGTSLRDVWRDLRRRRGALAPILVALESGRRARRWLHPRRELRRRAALARVAPRIHLVEDVHAEPVLERVRALSPDLALSYGSPILRQALFTIPRLGTLGIHHGRLPDYRGKKTPFWAIHSGEATAGVTIQRLNERLDAGQIVVECEVVVGRRTLGAVWRRLEALGVALYVEAILRVRDGSATFETRPGKGRLFRDPNPGDIALFWWRWLGRVLRGGPPKSASKPKANEAQ